MSFGDVVLILSILIALWFVPPYLWRVYHMPPIGAWIVSGFWFIVSCLSSSSDSHASSDTSSARLVPPQQHQSASELVPDFEMVASYLKRHNLTDEQAIDLLTLAKRETGDLLSANKIRDIVGGNEAQVKARVASHRPKPIQPRPPARIVRPENGW